MVSKGFKRESEERTFATLAEDLVLPRCESFEDELSPREVDLAVLSEVASHALQARLPNVHEGVDRTFANLERGEMGKEIVPDEEDEEDPVVDRALEVEGEGVNRRGELDSEVLAEDGDVEEDEGLVRGRLLDEIGFALLLLRFAC